MGIRNFLRYHFGIPRDCNWSYPVFLMSLGLLLFYLVKCRLQDVDLGFALTSITGFAMFIPLMTLVCLALPAVTLSRKFPETAVGKFSGAGVLIMSFFSGIPVMLISVSLHNLIAWTWLRIGNSMIFPVFFSYGGNEEMIGKVLGVLCDTVIPGFGACLFFFGLMWSRFRTSERVVGYTIVALVYALYSLDFINFAGLFITGLWLCFIRTKAGNIFAPFICLIGARLSEFVFADTIPRIDILTVQTYSDIGNAFFYTAVPSLFVGVVLIAFFKRGFNDFEYSYETGISDEEFDSNVPAFDRGLNPALISALIILITIWIMVIKGVHI